MAFMSVMSLLDKELQDDEGQESFCDHCQYIIKFLWAAAKEQVLALTYCHAQQPYIIQWCEHLHTANIITHSNNQASLSPQGTFGINSLKETPTFGNNKLTEEQAKLAEDKTNKTQVLNASSNQLNKCSLTSQHKISQSLVLMSQLQLSRHSLSKNPLQKPRICPFTT